MSVAILRPATEKLLARHENARISGKRGAASRWPGL
jgi:hypothetical protein